MGVVGSLVRVILGFLEGNYKGFHRDYKGSSLLRVLFSVLFISVMHYVLGT